MRIAFVGVFLLVLAQSVSAQDKVNPVVSCRPEPEPLMISLADFQALPVDSAKKRLSDTFADIKIFQEGLKVYRGCLERASQVMQQKAAEAREAPPAAQLQQLDNFWNATVEKEERVAGDFNALRGSLCSRGEQSYCN